MHTAIGPIPARLHGWTPVIGVSFGIAVLGTVLRCSRLTGPWGDSLTSLYYLPIVIAAIVQGTRAALGVALVSGLSRAVASAFHCGEPWMGPFVETVLYAGVGITAAKLSHVYGALAAAHPGAPKDRVRGNLQEAYRNVQGESQTIALRQALAGVIHRFRTPMASIENACSLLEERRFPEEQREEFVKIIHKESHQLDRAFCDILEFTQPRKPRLRKVDLSALLDQAIQKAGPKEHGPYFLFRKDIAPDLPRLFCDPEQIGRMFLNLLMNAIQSAPGGGQIEIAARAGADTVIITIRDHGRGIPSAIAGNVFDAFFTTRENALGLGLSVARQVAAAHCGNISLIECSEPGTCVSVELPLNLPDCHEHRPHIGS